VPLNVTLEELYTGTTKKRKVTRHIVDGASGKAMPIEETLEIQVKPGWKEGTRITFEGKGDETPGRAAQDLVFVLRQIPHPRLIREGDNLVTTIHIPLVKALTAGATVDVPALDNRILRVPLREVVTPGYTRVVKNEGMPVSKVPGAKGDFKIRLLWISLRPRSQGRRQRLLRPCWQGNNNERNWKRTKNAAGARVQ